MKVAIAVLIGIVGCRAAREPQPPTRTSTSTKIALEVPRRINREYEGKEAQDWEARFEREGREVFDRKDAILEMLALRAGMDVADVGAGSGLFTLAIARAVGPEGKVYAVDVQAYFLERIAERARAAKLANVVTVAADQRTSGLAEDSIDLALFVDSYHHLEHPDATLADVRRALRAGRRLVVIDYDRTGEHSER